MTERVLYDLAAADADRRFSPFCWRAKLALAHKQLPFDTIPWRFAEKDTLAFSQHGKVPILRDGERVVEDSWQIAEYLEATYPQAPSLFGGGAGLALTRFFNAYTDTVLAPQMASFVMIDIEGLLDEASARDFRKTREARFGKSLEAFCSDREARLPTLRATLNPVRHVLGQQAFLGGEAPLYADYCVFSVLQWARCVSPMRLLAADDAVAQWYLRVAAAHEAVFEGVPVFELIEG